ncbi:MAG TPA: PrgI family protein [Patescibacteria group bacterium]|nr:PrgI family protein [Patescibacteria group bacterium]
MEQHPVPQNVTTFQFRLIGDMTIKQFGYLAGGAILAYISFKLPLPFFFTWPLTTVFAIGGVGFAFVPVEERPMDIWVLSFIKSVYSPTQFVWARGVTPAPPVAQLAAKQAAPPAPPVLRAQHIQPAKPQPSPQQRPSSVAASTATQGARPIADILQSVFPGAHTQTIPQPSPGPVTQPQKPTIVTVHPKQSAWGWLAGLFTFSTPKPTMMNANVTTTNYPIPSITGKHIDFSPPPIVRPATPKPTPEAIEQTKQKEEALEQQVVLLKKDLASSSMTEARVLELQKQLTELLGERETMERELTALRRQAAANPLATTPPPIVPKPAPVVQSQSGTHVASPNVTRQPTVKIITPESAVRVGLPRLTSFPNIVTGIIKDGDNIFLPGVLVTVKDKEGVPLRALKTNRLGQFAASTPLANGVYFVEIEDPRVRYIFDRVQITLNGSIVPALEIIAKSQKQVNREKLEKEIFGKPTP